MEDALVKVLVDAAKIGRPLPRFALVGYHTWKRLKDCLLRGCPERHKLQDFTVATPVGMVSIAVDEANSEGIKLVYKAEHMRPR